MECISAHAIRAVVHGTLSLDPMNQKVCSYLTQVGPQFPLGRVVFEPDLWGAVATCIMGNALDLHWCGIWGAVSDVDRNRNIHTLVTGEGRVVSSWRPTRTTYPPFWIVTDSIGDRPETRVFTSFDA
jgi:hypothetical protein